jgi:hypothetical protein
MPGKTQHFPTPGVQCFNVFNIISGRTSEAKADFDPTPAGPVLLRLLALLFLKYLKEYQRSLPPT